MGAPLVSKQTPGKRKTARLGGMLVLLMVAVAPPALADAPVEWSYRTTRDGVTLSANPQSAASRTAFYLARGFTATAIRPYAQACGFSLVMQNDGPSAITTRLTDWHALGADGKPVGLRLPEAWDAEWQAAAVPSSARIAFRWAQFQTENSFQPGDWIMGMVALERPPVAPFRLVAHYRDERGNHEIVLDQLQCSSD